MAVVLDASLIATLVTGDPRGVRADGLLRGWTSAAQALHTTTLMRYELSSALTRCVATGALDAQQVAEAWATVESLGVEEHPIGDGPRIIEIAVRLKRSSAYDAAYVALAESLGAVLWTFDRALVRSATSLGFSVQHA